MAQQSQVGTCAAESMTTCALRATYFNNRRVRSGTEVRIEAQSVASVLDSRSSDLYASVRVSSDAGTIPPKSTLISEFRINRYRGFAKAFE